MNEILLIWDMEETLEIDDFVDASVTPVAPVPAEAMMVQESQTLVDFQAAKDAYLQGKRMVI